MLEIREKKRAHFGSQILRNSIQTVTYLHYTRFFYIYNWDDNVPILIFVTHKKGLGTYPEICVIHKKMEFLKLIQMQKKIKEEIFQEKKKKKTKI